MTKIINSKAKVGNKEIAYTEVQFVGHTFVVYADGTAYHNGKPLKE